MNLNSDTDELDEWKVIDSNKTQKMNRPNDNSALNSDGAYLRKSKSFYKSLLSTIKKMMSYFSGTGRKSSEILKSEQVTSVKKYESPNTELLKVDTQSSQTVTSTFEELIQDGNFLKIVYKNFSYKTKDISLDLIKISRHLGRSLDIIRLLVNYELETQFSTNVLFRTDSLVTRMITCYTNEVGTQYLRIVVGDTVPRVLDGLGNDSCEIDPNRCKDSSPQSLEKNIEYLKQSIGVIMDKILDSFDDIPPTIKSLFVILREEVNEKFPDSIYSVISGFFFLRFVCPAVISPQAYNFVDSIDNNQRRFLVLLSKSLQSVASNQTSFLKESYMEPTKEVVVKYSNKILNFYESLINVELESEDRDELTPVEYLDILGNVRTQLISNKDLLLAGCINTNCDQELLNNIKNMEYMPLSRSES